MNFVVNGTTPAVTNGIVSPSIIGQDSGTTGTFLTYGNNGFAPFTLHMVVNGKSMRTAANVEPQ